MKYAVFYRKNWLGKYQHIMTHEFEPILKERMINIAKEYRCIIRICETSHESTQFEMHLKKYKNDNFIFRSIESIRYGATDRTVNGLPKYLPNDYVGCQVRDFNYTIDVIDTLITEIKTDIKIIKRLLDK